MFGLGSAQGRAILAGVVLVTLLASVVTVAAWRTQNHREQHSRLEHTAAVTTPLEHARAQLFLETD